MDRRALDPRGTPFEAHGVMEPSGEPIGPRVTLRWTIRIWAHATARDRLELQSHKPEDVIGVDLE